MADEKVVVPLEDIQVDGHPNHVEQPVAIMDRKSKALKNKVVNLVNVRWQHRKGS